MVTFAFRGLPSGEYLVSGIVSDSGGRRRATAAQQVRVIPSGGGF
jgi:hypothetical protein